jgi:molybdate transport system substrate-binding protein
MRRMTVLALFLSFSFLPASAAWAATAAPVKILSDSAVEAGLRAAATAFTGRTGQDVSLTFTSASNVRRRLLAGEVPDLAVASAAVIDALVRTGKMDAADRTPVGQVGGAAYAMAPPKAAPVTAGAKAFTAYLRGDGRDVLTANGVTPAPAP